MVPPHIGGHHFPLCQQTNTTDIAGQSATQGGAILIKTGPKEPYGWQKYLVCGWKLGQLDSLIWIIFRKLKFPKQKAFLTSYIFKSIAAIM